MRKLLPTRPVRSDQDGSPDRVRFWFRQGRRGRALAGLVGRRGFVSRGGRGAGQGCQRRRRRLVRADWDGLRRMGRVLGYRPRRARTGRRLCDRLALRNVRGGRNGGGGGADGAHHRVGDGQWVGGGRCRGWSRCLGGGWCWRRCLGSSGGEGCLGARRWRRGCLGGRGWRRGGGRRRRGGGLKRLGRGDGGGGGGGRLRRYSLQEGRGRGCGRGCGSVREGCGRGLGRQGSDLIERIEQMFGAAARNCVGSAEEALEIIHRRLTRMPARRRGVRRRRGEDFAAGRRFREATSRSRRRGRGLRR